jgi:hypothetical protein
MDQQDTQADDAGAATDAATINSDAAVLEGVQQPPKRHEDGNPSPPPPQEAEVLNMVMDNTSSLVYSESWQKMELQSTNAPPIEAMAIPNELLLKTNL